MSQCFYCKTANTVYVSGDITFKLASAFRRRMIRAFQFTPEKIPIHVEINSPGGDLEAAYMMVDTIEEVKAKGHPVNTVVTGIAYSAAVVILAAGTNRLALQHSSIMVHQAKFTFKTLNDNLRSEVTAAESCQDTYWAMLDKYTGKEPGYWKQKAGSINLYLNREQAKEEGLLT